MAEQRRDATASEQARFRLLYDLGCAFASRIELDELLPFLVNQCTTVFDSEAASVLLLDAESNELYFPYVAEGDPEVGAKLQRIRIAADSGIAGAVLRTGTAVRVDDVSSHPWFLSSVDADTGFTTRSVLCAPLQARQGSIGVLQIINRRGGGIFSDDDLAFLAALAGSAAVAIENARLYARTRASEETLRVQVGALRRDLAHRDRFTDMVGSAQVMEEVFELMSSAAASPITVLIEGETGTGKELVARGIHRASARADGPFVAVNCAAVSEPLLESELFGHKRGAFTGATQDHRGLFEAAEGGTIFLDEVGEMQAAMQAKLLRVLQESEIVPVGETRPRKVDVRVISATNRNLEDEVRSGNFRSDLFYRLAVFPIRLPALRERREDIPVLCEHLIAKHRESTGCTGISDAAREILMRYEWPGNVRQLENELERAAVMAGRGRLIEPNHLSVRVRGESLTERSPNDETQLEAPGGTLALREARALFEAAYIRRALECHDYNVSRTARALGLSRMALQTKMKAYGLRHTAAVRTPGARGEG